MVTPSRIPILVAMLWLSQLTQPVLTQEISSQRANETEKRASSPPEYINVLDVRTIDSDEQIAPCDHPLFSYADSARVIGEGAIWAWGGTGRPLAMAKCWKNRNGTRTCAFSLTSDQRVIVRGPQFKTWRPANTQTEPTELPGAPAPDQQNAVRLRQLKEQARRFTAHEFWNPDNTRFELRLLVQPVHRYQDEPRQILDGAVFLLASDNNPQILLLIEALNPADGRVRWQYSLARVSSAELHVVLDGKQVWMQDRTPGIVGQPTDFYWHMVTAPEPSGSP
jgi:hypothetical protein